MAKASALGLFVVTQLASPRPCGWSHMALPPTAGRADRIAEQGQGARLSVLVPGGGSLLA